jgi:hypothetical protein
MVAAPAVPVRHRLDHTVSRTAHARTCIDDGISLVRLKSFCGSS